MQVQYFEIKKQYPDCLLFYRMGDFYEMFADDALVGSKALDIALTSRSKGENALPMCGVPYHAAEMYIAKLIEQGFKVAICDQMEDPKLAKGLVKREVTRVITPGTVIDGNLLKENSASYLAAVFPLADGFGLAYADISTGEFFAAESRSADALTRIGDELAAIDPKECIVPKALLDEPFFANHAWNVNGNIAITPAKDELFVRQNAETLLLTQFKLPSLEALGLKGLEGAVQAAAELLYFCQLTQKRELSYINNLQIYNIENYLILDANTRRNLELTSAMHTGKKKGSLYGVCDKCRTALGSRLLKKWIEKPLLDSAAVNLRLSGIEELLAEPVLHQNVLGALKNIADIERLISRVVYGNAVPRDLLALKHSFALLPQLEASLLALKSDVFRQLFSRLDTMEDICALIDETLYDPAEDKEKEQDRVDKKCDEQIIKPGFNAEIDELRHIRNEGGDIILEMEARERERTGIKSLKIGYNKVFGYFIDVRKTSSDNVPEDYIRRQTLVGSERFITQELKDLESKLLNAGERLNVLEQQLFAELRAAVVRQTSRIQKTAKCVAWLDCLAGLAALADENGYVKPIVDDSDCLILQAARHPVVELSIGRENYIPNDTYMKGDEKRFALITGPNMAGKSTYMRQVALAVIMARIGSYIPAAAGHIGKIDRIFTRVGASDDLSAGQSTFMVEMSETSNIIRNATRDSLIILDEIGRGTSTYDGLSIAWAVSEYILRPELSAKTLFATHYHELIELAASYGQVQNYSVAVREKGGSIVFLRKIVEGGTDKSYGVHVAKLAGLPQVIIDRANDILQQLETDKSERTNISGFLREQVQEETKPAENPLLDEIRGLDLDNLRPMEALLYIEKWQKELRND
jgi:DNA mismatch repair protein MutS